MDGGASWTTLLMTAADATGYFHREPSPGRTIYYRVIAINEHGAGPASNVISIVTEAEPPARPSNLRATPTGSAVLPIVERTEL